MEIGKNIRKRREANGWTLAQLAEKSGISGGMLSEIEREKKNPTIRTAWQIASALGCTISDLVDDKPHCEHEIVRAGDRQRFVDPESGIEREEIAPSFRCRGIEVVVYRLPPRTETSPFSPHSPGVAEHITVLKGAVRCTVGEISFELNEGDSASYSPQFAHGFQNPHDAPCEVMLIIDRTKATSV